MEVGDKVICNGYKGTIIRFYDGNMVEVRLSSGITCVDIQDIMEIGVEIPGSRARAVALINERYWNQKRKKSGPKTS